MEYGKRRDTTDTTVLPATASYGLAVYVADLWRTCYGATGAMKFWPVRF